MIGKTISHYQILEKLGEGGMGVVYKVQDAKLDRIVALKFLPQHLLCDEEAKARFVHEAKAASALDHPNIATIYEIDEAEGECFISMAYVEGKSLKDLIKDRQIEGWDIGQIIDVGVQIAEGLSKAHQKGIVHRDIKSDNIMVTNEGLAKIMDFGLAKLKGVPRVTKTGTTLGTIQYMSPEQAQGIEADHRSDVFSFGVVLFEMITDQLPFKGEHEVAVIYSIVNENPEPLARYKSDVPDELQRIVEKAMEKNPDMRYQHVDDLRADLRKLKKELESEVSKEQAAATKPVLSVAVLPFRDMSAQRDQEYFCEGMAENIINALTQVEDLRVVARASAFSFRGKEIDVREIGRKLNVETLLEGSIQKAGNRLRITAQLINVADGYHLWSDKYDRDMEDIFAIQDEISLAIVDKLKVKLLGDEKVKLVKRHTDSQEAYNLYLKGRYFWNRRTEEDLEKSIECFKRAIEKDPNYALAYTGLADSYIILPSYSSFPPEEAFPKAKEATLRALDIDNTLGEAYASLALIKLDYDWDWAGAEKQFKQAIELNPGYATAHHWYALHLMYRARFDEAIKEIKTAQELDPLSLVINRVVGRVFYFARRYDQAIDALLKTIEMEPNCSWVHLHLGSVYLQKLMYKEALAEFHKEKELSRGGDVGDIILLSSLGLVHAKMGKRGEAEEALDELIKRSKQAYVSPTGLALIYFALGKNDQGFEWLEKAYDDHDLWLRQINVEPAFDSVRSDPRFKALLKKVGLEK
jgi:serine/threonine protein kinase/Tfp pilus assembly protein PilF